MRMPEPDAGVIARRAEIAAALREIVPGEGVISEEDARRPYESDVPAPRGTTLILWSRQ